MRTKIEVKSVHKGFVTKTGSLDVVEGVSFTVGDGELVAIVGPSGCGKTTLMSVLRGANEGSVTGTVAVNGVVMNGEGLARLQCALGFVPQEDVLDRALTVRELLDFNARMRLPASTTAGARAAIVARVMTDLNLHGIANTVIGGGTNLAANISGGQLKRVNVAVELVAQPAALFLDGASR